MRTARTVTSWSRRPRLDRLPAGDRMVRETATGFALKGWLEQSGAAISLSGLLVVSLGAALLGGVVGGALGGALVGRPLATGLCALCGLVAPSAVPPTAPYHAVSEFEEHFPEALDLISRAVRAGHAFTAGSQDDRRRAG